MAKGTFRPKHPEKYIGNVNNIVFRSGWELQFMKFLDSNINIIKWASEEVKIPYVKPTDGKVHFYFPDFFMMYKNTSNQIVKELVEIKPMKEAIMRSRSSTYDKISIAINHAKWEAAQTYCLQHNMSFHILTENSLFRKKRK